MAIAADAVAYSKINSVVLQFNDLGLRRGKSQRNARRFSRVVGKLSARKCGPRSQPPRSYSRGRRDVNTHVRIAHAQRTKPTFNFTRKFFEPKRKSGD